MRGVNAKAGSKDPLSVDNEADVSFTAHPSGEAESLRSRRRSRSKGLLTQLSRLLLAIKAILTRRGAMEFC